MTAVWASHDRYFALNLDPTQPKAVGSITILLSRFSCVLWFCSVLEQNYRMKPEKDKNSNKFYKSFAYKGWRSYRLKFLKRSERRLNILTCPWLQIGLHGMIPKSPFPSFPCQRVSGASWACSCACRNVWNDSQEGTGWLCAPVVHHWETFGHWGQTQLGIALQENWGGHGLKRMLSKANIALVEDGWWGWNYHVPSHDWRNSRLLFLFRFLPVVKLTLKCSGLKGDTIDPLMNWRDRLCYWFLNFSV